MSDRFFVSPPIDGSRAVLTGDEARHLTAVMRAGVGDEIVLFDGSGSEFVCRIESVGKRSVELTVVERREISRELPFSLTLAVALPKGERQKWLVEKATELGVTRIVPLVTQRGVAQPVEAALERLRRAVVEASKQCGRNRLLEMAEPAAAGDYFRSAPPTAMWLIAEPGGTSLSSIRFQPAGRIIAAIGPEGGFAPDELAAATAAGWQLVSLGGRILRVETAAIAIAAWAGISFP
jgi:16S rRNA (uracil1498-N3)-methyltransferase